MPPDVQPDPDAPPDPREVLTRAVTAPDHVLAYGDHPDHVVDLRLPRPAASRAEPAGLVVVLHGGFWRQRYDRTAAGAASVGLVEAGYAVATVEYRRVGGSGGYPQTLDDVAAVVDALPDLVSPTVSAPVDTSRTTLVGHSAGGHLALWAAQRHLLPQASRWWRPARSTASGVVCLGGVVDLLAARRAHLGEGAVDDLVGTADTGDIDPALLPDPDLPVVLVHGTVDVQVPLAIARGYAATHPGAHLWELEGVDHFGVVDPRSPAWSRVLQAVELVAAPPTTIGDRADR